MLKGIRRGGLAAALILGLALVPSSASATTPSVKPTIVLEHGAFADASSWNAVIARLQRLGYPVVAPANPLSGLPSDTAYLKAVLATITGPVVLVGHSYGGAVISGAATGDPDVKALVFIAAYALAEGESVSQANELGGAAAPLLTQHLVPLPVSATHVEASIDPAWFRQIFAADLPPAQTAIMAAGQRPASLSALADPAGVPAWKTIPSWYLVARQDNAIPPAAEKYMAKRANARTVTVDSSHVAMISHPDLVTKMITEAATSR